VYGVFAKASSQAFCVRLLPAFMVTVALLVGKSMSTRSTPSMLVRIARTLSTQL
jgi:hypothetical protein